MLPAQLYLQTPAHAALFPQGNSPEPCLPASPIVGSAISPTQLPARLPTELFGFCQLKAALENRESRGGVYLIKLELCNLAITVTHTCNLGGFSSFFVLSFSFKKYAALIALSLMLQSLVFATPIPTSQLQSSQKCADSVCAAFRGLKKVNLMFGSSQSKRNLLFAIVHAFQALHSTRLILVWTEAC